MTLQKRRQLEDAAKQAGIDMEVLIHFIEWEWIHPVDFDHKILDEEDIARARLIHELQQDFGVNQEAIPIILHLVDQLNLLHIHLHMSEMNATKVSDKT
jgi:chaperone modulatory protein CbpM